MHLVKGSKTGTEIQIHGLLEPTRTIIPPYQRMERIEC